MRRKRTRLLRRWTGKRSHSRPVAADVCWGGGMEVQRAHRCGSRQREAWEDRNKVLSNLDFLVAPRRGAAKRSMTDSSAYRLGRVLLSEEANGKRCPISFARRKLSQSEKTFTVVERKYMAVVHRFRKWVDSFLAVQPTRTTRRKSPWVPAIVL